jgi:hypothetical protein
VQVWLLVLPQLPPPLLQLLLHCLAQIYALWPLLLKLPRRELSCPTGVAADPPLQMGCLDATCAPLVAADLLL